MSRSRAGLVTSAPSCSLRSVRTFPDCVWSDLITSVRRIPVPLIVTLEGAEIGRILILRSNKAAPKPARPARHAHLSSIDPARARGQDPRSQLDESLLGGLPRLHLEQRRADRRVGAPDRARPRHPSVLRRSGTRPPDPKNATTAIPIRMSVAPAPEGHLSPCLKDRPTLTSTAFVLKRASVGIRPQPSVPTSQVPFSITTRPSAVIRPPCGYRESSPSGGSIHWFPRLGITLAQGQVDGSPDLLIVEDAAGEPIDSRIQP